MMELVQALRATPDTACSRVRPALNGERHWLAALAVIFAVELAWWALAWNAGIAPPPLLGRYLLTALTMLCAVIVARCALGLPPTAASWRSVLSATALVGAGASLFLPLKYAIPREIPFWLDTRLATAERAIFSVDPWLLLDRLLGWATMPMDRLYGLWLPVQTLVLFALILDRPSRAKSHALLAYSLAWFLLGVVAATLLASAGPIFHDRLFGGAAFAALPETLHARGAWVVLAESDRMWASHIGERPGMVAGISAVPSIHVAISVWMVMVARSRAPKALPVAVAYAILIGVGSVQLGWHYVTDGLAGAAGMFLVWRLAAALQPNGPAENSKD